MKTVVKHKWWIYNEDESENDNGNKNENELGNENETEKEKIELLKLIYNYSDSFIKTQSCGRKQKII